MGVRHKHTMPRKPECGREDWGDCDRDARGGCTEHDTECDGNRASDQWGRECEDECGDNREHVGDSCGERSWGERMGEWRKSGWRDTRREDWVGVDDGGAGEGGEWSEDSGSMCDNEWDVGDTEHTERESGIRWN